MQRILHLVPGADNLANGIAVAARLIAASQGVGAATVIDLSAADAPTIRAADEVWVHSMWLPEIRRVCRLVLAEHKPLIRMPHGALDPIRLNYHAWKKCWFSIPERALYRRAARIVVTCPAEEKWTRDYVSRIQNVEIIDLRKFFPMPATRTALASAADGLHLLYLGRRHPLKGIEFLEAAVMGLKGCTLRIESNVFGEEKERLWEWCDVLVLPTLSENFGLVVAEALAHGKRVITTDGAPVWSDLTPEQGIYIHGYRDATRAHRVNLLRDAILTLLQRARG